jgi:23S rRNA pseudouridine2605 synthase
MKNRLSKVMAAAGVASRRACEELIFAGKVQVNGEVVLLPQTIVDSSDDITLNGNRISSKPQSKVYYMVNKPEGYICTSRSDQKTKIVLDLFTDSNERLFTVGRLDKDTKGLLLVTNDGHFANRVIHPSANVVKEYLAKTDQEITADHLKAISSGTLVEGVFVKPLHVVKVRRGTVKIAVGEGKKREVRMLLQGAGLEVLELTRIRIGGLHLGSLPEGQWRAMSEGERALIFNGASVEGTHEI